MIKVLYKDNNNFIDDHRSMVDLNEYSQKFAFKSIEELQDLYTSKLPDVRGTDGFYSYYGDEHYLEMLFEMFNAGSLNCVLPEWLFARSLSVNDVIQMDDNYYEVAALGWRKVEIK